MNQTTSTKIAVGRISGTAILCVVLFFTVISTLSWFFTTNSQQQILVATHLADAQSQLSHVKRLVTFYFAESGRLAKQNRTLGLGLPSTFARNAVSAITVQDGHILVEFNEQLESDIRMLMRTSPSLSRVGSRLKWQCEVSGVDAELLKAAAPSCKAVDTAELPTAAPN